jgi:hypothetical protein
MGGQNQMVGTMGGFGGNLGTAGTMGGQQNTIGTMGGFGGNLGTAGTLGGQQNNVPQFAQNYLQQQQMGQQNNVPQFAQNYLQQQQMGQQMQPQPAGTLPQQNTIYGSVPFNNSQNQQPALTMMPQNQGPYTGPTDPSAVVNRLGNMGGFFQQQQMGLQPQQQQQQPLQPPQQVAQPIPLPQQQPDMSTAIGQLKGGDQFAAQNTMRQLVGLPPLQAPAYNANPTMSDVQQLLQSGDKASAQEMMQRMVGLPATGAPNQRTSPAPAVITPAVPQGIQRLLQARPPRRRFGRM